MINIGILSTAHGHADAYAAGLRSLDNARLVGVWDDNAERRAKKAIGYGTEGFESAEALVEKCDAVVICSENIHHRPLTELAAKAGKHVISEKPLATTPEDARAMVDACAQAGVLLMTAFPCRFSPAFVQLDAAVKNGDLGEILAVRGTNQGKCPGGWFVDKALSGGGCVTDHTVHVTDLLRVLLAGEVESVYCEADNGLLHGDFEDTGFVALNFPGGVFATLDSSWSRARIFPTWGNVTLGVTGTKGVIEVDMFAQESVLYSDEKGRISYQNWGSNIDTGLVAAFVRSVEAGTPQNGIATGVDGQRAVEVVEAAYESIRTHQPAAVRQR
jgi:predicted dehydrogenase